MQFTRERENLVKSLKTAPGAFRKKSKKNRHSTPPPPCDIPSGCCSVTGPWTVTRSSLRMLRRVAAFCRPLRPVLLLVSFPRSRSPAVGVLGLCWLLWGSFDCLCCPRARPSIACLAVLPPSPPPMYVTVATTPWPGCGMRALCARHVRILCVCVCARRGAPMAMGRPAKHCQGPRHGCLPGAASQVTAAGYVRHHRRGLRRERRLDDARGVTCGSATPGGGRDRRTRNPPPPNTHTDPPGQRCIGEGGAAPPPPPRRPAYAHPLSP